MLQIGLVFILSMLFHEFMHIKSQGFTMGGKIYVYKYGLAAIPNEIKDTDLYYYGGGVLTAIVFLLASMTLSGWWQFAFWSSGIIQLCYGIYEGKNPLANKLRYLIYIGVFILCLLFWNYAK
ncbi:MAG: hypothetical protein ACFFC1_10495 [Promethearchaeota archaeon]